MRAGDVLLLLIIAASVAGLLVDETLGGALSSSLVAIARALGRFPDIWILIACLPAVSVLMCLGLVMMGRLSDGISSYLRAKITITDWISTTLADAVRWLALGLVLVTVTVVIQRYVFGASSTKLQESVIYFHALLFLFSAGAALLADAHVRVDIVYSKLGEKGKAWTDIIGYILALLPMSVLIIYTSQSYVGSAWRSLEGSRESDGLPLIFLLKSAIPVFALLMAFQGAAMAARGVLRLADRDAPALPDAVEKEL